MTTLLHRIDTALQVAGKTRGDLARHLGLSTQAISGLSRSETASLKPENIAKAAAFLKCDCAWLCGLDAPAPYKADTVAQMSELAREVAELVETLEPTKQHEALSTVYLIAKRNSPVATTVTNHDNYGKGAIKVVKVKASPGAKTDGGTPPATGKHSKARA